MKSTRWLWLVLVIAFLLRLPLLNGSFWLDEAAQALESARPFSQQLDIAADFQPPLLHYIVHFALYAHNSEWWLRLWGALIPGLVSIAGVWWLGKKWFSPKAGFIAALLLATNSFHIFYSQELRPYSLPAMWAVLSWMTVAVLLDAKKSASKSTWLLWATFSLAGWYSSYLYPFVWAIQWAVLAVAKRKESFNLIGFTILTLLGFAPWLPGLFEQLRVGNSVQESLPGWSDVVGTPWLKSLPLTVGKLLFGVLDLSLNAGYLIAVAVILGCCGLLVWQQKNQFLIKKISPEHIKYLLPFIWLTAPLLLSWIASLWLPVLQPKRVLYIWPAASLVFAQLLIPSWEAFWSQKKVKLSLIPGLLLGLLVTSITLFSTLSYWRDPKLQREDWRGLIAELEMLTTPSKTVALFAFPGPFAPWDWYASPEIETMSSGVLSVSQLSSVRNFVEPSTEYEYIITFEYLQQLSDPNKELEENVKLYEYKEVYQLDYPLIGFTKVWAKQATTLSDVESL